MTRPYSGDLRFRVASAVLNGQTCRKAAAVFAVSVSCAATWSKRMRETGSAAAKPMGGARRDALLGERQWLLSRMAETPDVTLRQLRSELAGRGVMVSLWTVWKVFVSADITFKKKHSTRRTGAARHRQPQAAVG